MDSELGSFILFEQVEGEPIDEGEVLRSVSSAFAAQVFAEGDIEYPMEFVLDTPMLANGLIQLSGLGWETGNVVSFSVLPVALWKRSAWIRTNPFKDAHSEGFSSKVRSPITEQVRCSTRP